MKKLSLSIDLLKLQGACRATIKGRDCIIIKLDEARAKPHQNGAVYLNLEAVERKDGADQYGKTHFVVEPTTKDERDGGLKLPIIGNGKEFGDLAAVKKQVAAPPQPARRPPPRQDDDFGETASAPIGPMEDDDIPF